MPSSLGFSQLATLYYKVPVSATSAGEPVNPTSLPVVFAFMPQATQVPQSSDWQTGSWETNTSSVLYPYSARCLVGPAGTITLGAATYVVYMKITSDPEIPVLVVGYLQIQ
jgi:hypothetical protein